MITHLRDKYDFSHGKLTLTRARLNPPFYVKSDDVFAVALKNHGDSPLLLQSFNLTCGDYIDGSAVMFNRGKKIPLKATVTENKITLEGIEIPPRESVVIFYKERPALT